MTYENPDEMSITVLQEDIDRSKILLDKGGACSEVCPLALALNRQGGKWTVGNLLADNIGVSRYILSKEARAFIQQYDSYMQLRQYDSYTQLDPEPGTFTLTIGPY